MRKGLYFVAFVCVFTMVWTAGCTDKKTAAADSIVTDTTVTDTLAADTNEVLLSEQMIPMAADELFDDFLFIFTGNKRQQLKRIKFPLEMVENGHKRNISRNEWKTDHFFMEQGFYTLIFDNRKQMELPKDTSVNHVIMEKIIFSTSMVERYHFDRLTGKWMLTKIHKNPISENPNASFLSFYHHFVTDSVFQMQSLDDFVTFSGPNPDDDFEELVGEITPEQWPAFAPTDLPDKTIYNIIYGDEQVGSNQKIFLLRGISNGQELELTFKHNGGQWKLLKLVE